MAAHISRSFLDVISSNAACDIVHSTYLKYFKENITWIFGIWKRGVVSFNVIHFSLNYISSNFLQPSDLIFMNW